MGLYFGGDKSIQNEFMDALRFIAGLVVSTEEYASAFAVFSTHFTEKCPAALQHLISTWQGEEGAFAYAYLAAGMARTNNAVESVQVS